jgi:hypothetical protein
VVVTGEQQGIGCFWPFTGRHPLPIQCVLRQVKAVCNFSDIFEARGLLNLNYESDHTVGGLVDSDPEFYGFLRGGVRDRLFNFAVLSRGELNGKLFPASLIGGCAKPSAT